MGYTKYTHMYMFHFIDHQEISEQQALHMQDFNEAFAEFIYTAQNTKPAEEEAEESETSEASELTEHLYKKLSKKVHPDKSDAEDAEEEFVKLKELLQENNVADMILMAEKHGVEIPEELLNEEAIESIKNNIDQLEEKKASLKNTVSWIYYNGPPEKRMILPQLLAQKWSIAIAKLALFFKNTSTDVQ